MSTPQTDLAPTTQNNGAITPEPPKKVKSAALAVKDWMSAPTMKAALSNALSGYMDQEMFSAQCYIAAQNPKLAACSAESLFKAFLECAQMGLLPGTHHRHVAMVPRGGAIEITPQWQGFKFLMEKQTGIKRVKPVLVHTSDEFKIENGEANHVFDPFNDKRVFEHPDITKGKRDGGLRGGYLRIDYENGDVEYHFVSAAKIERNRACAKTQEIWMKWYEEMCLKTVIRDAWSKRIVSIDPELAVRVGRMEETDNRVIGNDPSRVKALLATAGGEDTPDMSKAAEAPEPPTGHAALGVTVEPVAEATAAA